MRTLFADRQVATREFIFSARSPHERRLFVVRFLPLPLSLSFSIVHCPLSVFIAVRFFSLGFEYFNGSERRKEKNRDDHKDDYSKWMVILNGIGGCRFSLTDK